MSKTAIKVGNLGKMTVEEAKYAAKVIEKLTGIKMKVRSDK